MKDGQTSIMHYISHTITLRQTTAEYMERTVDPRIRVALRIGVAPRISAAHRPTNLISAPLRISAHLIDIE